MPVGTDEMTPGVLWLVLALAPPSPTPGWTAAHTNVYQLQVPAGQTRTVDFPIPAALARTNRPMTFTWSIVRPVPAPRLVILEQCVRPEACYPTVMMPTGQASGTVGTAFRITNRSQQAIDVRFRFTVWNAP